MLKGKGVGRAKIKVKVKTTKRKYPKNIKWMQCTANVKADDTATTEAFKATSAVANSTTEVRVSFNQAIDTPDKLCNFRRRNSIQGRISRRQEECGTDNRRR